MNDLTIGAHAVRRDGEMWCVTDLWRAAAAPKAKRPVDYARTAECSSFGDFLRLSPDVANSHVWKTRKIQGGGETWAHWQLALAYAKWVDHAFHARVNEVYRAFTAGQLVPVQVSTAEIELIRLSLRAAPSPTKSPWTIRIKEEVARLYGIRWVAGMPEPRAIRSAYGYIWRIILGDAVYRELKRRNPYPKSGSLHAEWLQEQRLAHARERDFSATEALIQRASTWDEFVHDMRAFFRREPLQLVMAATRIKQLAPNKKR